jgi:aspartyl-tRNA(Asn)/glutamyl-tRNA(Gln) amidotransferase subunit A
VTTPNSDLCALGVAELARLYRRRELSPVEVTRATLDRIARLNPELNAYLTVMSESAMAAAHAAEGQLRAGIDLGPLHGVPVSVKDIIRVQGTRTTAASKVLLDAPLDTEDATVARRLRAGGAVIVGKVNLHEFAFGDPDPDGPFGNVQNPRRLGHQSGASSSGSGAATAAGLGVLSLGSDTGGSIRHPAAVCGVVGLKPTYGLVPVRGVIPLSVHLDHVGPLGRSVADVAAGLTAIAGWDPDDPFSLPSPAADYLAALRLDVRGLRMGVPTNSFFQFGLPVALEQIARAYRALEDGGLVPIPLELPRVPEATELVRTVLIPIELWSYHERHRDREALYGRNFLERARPGREAGALPYLRAKDAQAEIRRDWRALFERVDVIALPANVAGAVSHGQSTIELDGVSHPVRAVTSAYNPISNLTGFPVMVVPIGETPEGLPIGLQLIAAPLGEARLLAVGQALEQAMGTLTTKWGIEPRRGDGDGPRNTGRR